MIDPEERAHKAYRFNRVGKATRDFSANVIRTPKVRIIQLDGSGERQYDRVPDLDRTPGLIAWDLSVVQGYIAKMIGQIDPKDLVKRSDRLDPRPA